MLQDYQHQPLHSSTSLRLIHVTRRHDSEPVDFTLVEWDLNDPLIPDFECLSYCWDLAIEDKQDTPKPNNSASHQMILRYPDNVNSKEPGRLSINENLHDFLALLKSRFDSFSPHLWIDAVCINQDDMAERASQVKLMSRLYSSCQRVTIWLGQGDDDYEIVCDALQHLKLIPPESWTSISFPPGSLLRKGMTKASVRRSELGLDPLFEASSHASKRFFRRRRWFRRTWTLQELLLARDVVWWCGTRAFGSTELWKYTEHALDSLVADKTSQLATRCKEDGPFSANVEALMTESRARQSQDLHDRIYGILGLVPAAATVDYRIPVADVYMQFARSVGVERSVPFALKHRSRRRIQSLPSWVPDFSVPQGVTAWTSCGVGNFYSAGGDRGWSTLPNGDPRVLAVEGIFVDKVARKGGQDLDLGIGQLLAESLGTLRDMPCQADGECLVQTFWKTLIVGCWYSAPVDVNIIGPQFTEFVVFHMAKWIASLDPEDADITKVKVTLKKLVVRNPSCVLPSWTDISMAVEHLRGSSSQPGTVAAVLRNQMLTFEAIFEQRFTGRCFFLTRKFRMGIGHDLAKVGTLICIVKGCDFPWLLEPTSSGRYQLIGYAYVNGIMNGEAFDKRKINSY